MREAGVEVAFSDLPHADGSPRLFWLRTSLMPRFLAVARAMNDRGWVLKVEDAYRTPAMQRALGTRPALFAAILEKVHLHLSPLPSAFSLLHHIFSLLQVLWEYSGDRATPSREELASLLIARTGSLIAAAPKVGTHMSGSAIDISVLHRGSREEVDRGAPYLELSELTPMASPFISAEAAANRREITALFAAQGFLDYPWEFWHYSAGDAYEGLLKETGKPGRYGAVELEVGSGAVAPMADPTVRHPLALQLLLASLRRGFA